MTKAFNQLFLATVLQASFQRWVEKHPYRHGITLSSKASREPKAFLSDWRGKSIVDTWRKYGVR